ncbi:MAG: acyl-CoA dehydrogenase [Chloroflexi bacterium]|nr:MAG: acyl-CoA dehydrogenase [Chloroflexota bacterium]
MDFGFNEEQELLRSQARDFLDRECGSARVRELMATEDGYDEGMWRRMVELGWTAIPFPEQYGGLGLGIVDLVVVLEEMGRHTTPAPLQSSVALAGTTLLLAGSEEQRARLLPGICDGTGRGTVALVEASGRWDAHGVQLRAQQSGDAYVLRGEKLFVPDVHVSDWMLVATRTAENSGDGLTLLLVDSRAPRVRTRRLGTIDQTRRLFEVGFDDVEVPADAVIGAPGRGWAALRRGLDRALVAVSAELCGTAQRAMEMSVDYAKTRQQFGRPIGAYQAVSHKLADMLVQVESAKSLTYYAAWAVDNDVPEAPLAASMAKAYASDAARWVTGAAIQVHGGIGFTWEHDAHLFFKRAKWGEATFGDAAHHRARVAEALDL